MNRRLWIAAAAAVASSCNRTQKKTIGMVPKGRTHVFWQSVQAGAVAASREAGVEISWNGPATETDFNGQIQIVDAMINRKVDAICLAPIDKKSMVGVVNRAVDANIPVIIFDSGLDNDRFSSQIATDNYVAGSLAADRMGAVLNGKGKVVIVAVQPGVASTMAREAGFEETLAKKFPGINIADKRYGNADYAQSLKVAENMLTAHADLTGIFASNESSTAGASQAVKARGTKCKLVGFDSSVQLLEDLRSGVIDSLIAQHPFQMGYRSIMTALQVLRGEKVEKIQNIVPLLVTQQNLNEAEVQARLNPDLKKYLN